MREALHEAWLGRGFCAPNPSVGAVVVHQGRIIAKAHHQGAGNPHAEQLVLEDPKILGLSDITLYVTLEPCNHWGRTPPCVDFIIKHKVKRVVYGCEDPNPVVRAKDTTAILRSHGIEVFYLEMPEVLDFYASYIHWVRTGYPWVTVKMAQSLDGKIGYSDKPKYVLSNLECAEFTHTLRLHSDILCTSERTIDMDNPHMNVRLGDTIHKKPLAILDRALRLKQDRHIWDTTSSVIVFHDAAMPKASSHDKAVCHGVPSNAKGLCLKTVFKRIGELGFHDVLVEVGGSVFTNLHALGLVNTTYMYIVPVVLGTEGMPGYPIERGWSAEISRLEWIEKQGNMILRMDWAMEHRG